MPRALAYALALMLSLALPSAGLARETTKAGPVKTALKAGVPAKAKSAKTSSQKKKKITTAQKKKKPVLHGKRLVGKKATFRKASFRRTSLHDPMGEPYTGGELRLRSNAVLVVDQHTGEPLYAKNAHLSAPIASITKLMTAMVVLDAGLPLNEEITIEAEDVDRLKGTSSRLPLGSTLTRWDLLNLALIASENRAAAALSRAYPGGREAFVAAMNRKAEQLGMYHTRFVDGTGLSSENRSTAADLAKLVDAAYRYPLIRRISTTGSFDLIVPVQQQVRHLAYHNTNVLTRRADWEIGVSKTGYINEAGHCLVMQAQISGRNVIIVLLDSWGKLSRIGDANRIRQWLEHADTGRLASRMGKTSV
ncbi:MAG: D-alanyl-D-alanine endopeptidase [Burkholderiales bacterium]|nr:D-alanyl-D-alanine endopeptidase [Burkholderiales bacterium]